MSGRRVRDQARRELDALAQTRRRAHDTVEQLRELAIRPRAWRRSDPLEVADAAGAAVGAVKVRPHEVQVLPPWSSCWLRRIGRKECGLEPSDGTQRNRCRSTVPRLFGV